MVELREALAQYDDGEAGTHQVSELAAAARRFLALTETGQRVHVCQNRLGDSLIHMAGNPSADAADNLRVGAYLVVPFGEDAE